MRHARVGESKEAKPGARGCCALVVALVVALVLLANGAHVLAVDPLEPVGLKAIERFDLISAVRQDVRTYQYSSHAPSGGNGDSDNYLQEIGQERLLLDVKGPGCIERIWFTGEDPGDHIQIHFDGSPTPLVDLPIGQFFSGHTAPFLGPLVGEATQSSGGFYCYLPMLFREGCKIKINALSGSDRYNYYNITYHRFADAANITTFTGQENSQAARNLWLNAGSDPKSDPGEMVITQTISLPAGSSATLADVQTAATVQRIEITIPGLSPTSPTSDALLSGLRLLAYWDGSSTAAVDVPIGEFFGCGLGAYTVGGLPAGISGERLYAYWPMPFRTRGLVRLVNGSGESAQNLTCTVRYTPSPPPPAHVGYFYAKSLAETPTTVGRDYLMLSETGSGQFVGVVHTLRGRDLSRSYLEGDERIYVDGNLTPALYGTGTEDFYNGGWYFENGPFTLPVHGNPAHEITSRDATACYRFFLSDLIPFTTSIRVGIEHGGNNEVTPDYSSVAFYYKLPQASATLTDQLDVGNSGSESAHGYSVSGGTWSGTTSGTYEGDDDTVNVNDNGRRLSGASQFTVALSSINNGVILRRRMDYSYANQEAQVYVDGALAGVWYEPGQNTNHIFRDSEFMVPSALTRNKGSIQIRIQNVSATNWTEYRYWVYTRVPLAPGPDTNPSPAHLATFVPRNADLSWTPGWGASSHDVYFGATNPPAPRGNQVQTVFDPGTLISSTTYYWRIDARNDAAVTTGPLWSFTTEPVPGDSDGDADVDQEDFGFFQVCLSGPGCPYAEGCRGADLNANGEVDLDDFSIFQACMGGANDPSPCGP